MRSYDQGYRQHVYSGGPTQSTIRDRVGHLPLPRTGQGLAAVMSGMIGVLKEPKPSEAASQQYWRLFERYLDSIRPQKDERGTWPEILLPTMSAWNAYFIALAADRQGYRKVYRAVQVAEQEFDFHLSHLAYTNVLRACSMDYSQEAAKFALRIIEGLAGSEEGPGKKPLNFAALACMNADMMEDALRLVKEIRERHSQGLHSDFHVRRTHENLFAACAEGERLDDALELALAMKQHRWALFPTPLVAVLWAALREQKKPEYLLQMLNQVKLPAAAERRPDEPFLEEGLVMAILAEAARRGHVELALRAWDFLEFSLLPLDQPLNAPVHGEGDDEAWWGGEAPQGAPPSSAAGGEPVEAVGVSDADALLPIYKPSVAAFQSLVDTFANAGDFKQAFRMVWQLQQVHPDRPDAVAFQTALSTLVNAIAESPESADAVYFELEDMHKKGEPVSGPMLDCIVAACSQMGDLGRAFETFEAYATLGLKPDAQAYNAVIMGCVNHGMTASVPKILEEMKTTGVPFNALTWSLHVEYHVVLHDAQAAAAVEQAARRAGCHIRPSSFEKLIRRCERNGEVALLENYAKQQRQGYKDTSLDLSKLLRWRWKDRGGMQALTGSNNFRPRHLHRPWFSHPSQGQEGYQRSGEREYTQELEEQ